MKKVDERVEVHLEVLHPNLFLYILKINGTGSDVVWVAEIVDIKAGIARAIRRIK